jgi:glycosyl transferase family 25
MKVYEMFVSSGHDLGLVIEDDILGEDDDIRAISNVAKNMSDGDLLICGGQDGTKGYDHLRGRPAFNNLAYQIPKPFFRFLSRTCCYVITPKIARHLISKQTACLDRADHWRCLVGGVGGRVYFVDRISHPIDLRGSHIESSRPGSGVIENVIADGVFYTVVTQMVKILPSFGLHKIRGKKNGPRR